jgi:hypothetical protein
LFGFIAVGVRKGEAEGEADAQSDWRGDEAAGAYQQAENEDDAWKHSRKRRLDHSIVRAQGRFGIIIVGAIL